MKEECSPRQLLRLLKPRLPEMLTTLRKFVVCESPSLEKAAADECCGLVGAEWRKQGLRVERLDQKHRGDHLRVTWLPSGRRAAGQILVLGHYDTVYSVGTLRKMPFRVSAGKAYGPGAFDMKAGIVQALFAVDTLQKVHVALRKRVVFLWTSDEEIGSESSRKTIEEEARHSDAVFVLEPSFGPKGLLKTARKGVGDAEIVVHGRASHAGLAPQEGVNAIHELALQIERVQNWNDLRRGVSVNVCGIEGGSRGNVIPERAKANFDLRALRGSDMRTIEKRFKSLRPVLPGARLEVRAAFNRPPLERKATAALFARAREVAKQMGLQIGECTVGGGSDGNLTGALGIPTLDGFGAVGDGAHSQHEHVVTRELPVRAALLAALLLDIGAN
jgi:glutamate carboxypeptidase